MDAQLKKGLIEYSVLASLATADSYGYQLLQTSPAVLGLTQSTLYPLLRRLEQDGRVTTYAKMHNGRRRNYYHLTAAGRASIAAFVTDWHEVLEVFAGIRRGIDDTQ